RECVAPPRCRANWCFWSSISCCYPPQPIPNACRFWVVEPATTTVNVALRTETITAPCSIFRLRKTKSLGPKPGLRRAHHSGQTGCDALRRRRVKLGKLARMNELVAEPRITVRVEQRPQPVDERRDATNAAGVRMIRDPHVDGMVNADV